MNEINTNTAANEALLYGADLINKVEDQWVFNADGKAELAWCPCPGDIVRVAVHSGPFHADDVLAVALLELFWLERGADVVRTRDPEVLEGCVRVDVGEGLLDHHGVRAEPGVAACTRVWQLLNQSGLVPEYAPTALDDLVRAVAAWDTGDCSAPNPLGYVHDLCALATAHEANGDVGKWGPDLCKTYDKAFAEALKMVRRHLLAMLGAARAAEAAAQAAEAAMVEYSDKPVVVFDRAARCAPVKEMLWKAGHSAIFYISPEGDEDWRVLCAADPGAEFSPFSSRKLLKEEFRGLCGDSLSAAGGIAGGIFCHAAGFIAGFKTREAAEKFAYENL